MKMWEVLPIGAEKVCPTCGRSFGISGTSKPTPSDLKVLEDVVNKPEPPPCGEMGVWSDEESDVQPQ